MTKIAGYKIHPAAEPVVVVHVHPATVAGQFWIYSLYGSVLEAQTKPVLERGVETIIAFMVRGLPHSVQRFDRPRCHNPALAHEECSCRPAVCLEAA